MAFTTTPFTQSYDISSQGTLTIGSCLLGGFKEATLSIEGETVDNYSRDDSGWTCAVPSRRSGELQVTFLKLESDACQVGLRAWAVGDNFLTDYAEIVYRSESGSTAPGSGFKGNFILRNLEEKQTDGGDAVECTATFSLFGALTSDTASAAAAAQGGGSSGGTT